MEALADYLEKQKSKRILQTEKAAAYA